MRNAGGNLALLGKRVDGAKRAGVGEVGEGVEVAGLGLLLVHGLVGGPVLLEAVLRAEEAVFDAQCPMMLSVIRDAK